VAGILVGTLARAVPLAWRWQLVGALGLVFGFFASLLSGELFVSFWFGIADSLFVAAVAVSLARIPRTSTQSY